jgi:hypothetical protein
MPYMLDVVALEADLELSRARSLRPMVVRNTVVAIRPTPMLAMADTAYIQVSCEPPSFNNASRNVVVLVFSHFLISYYCYSTLCDTSDTRSGFILVYIVCARPTAR